ncbi:MAG: hypothetical protein VCB25_09895 [Myxococcota bacterium]
MKGAIATVDFFASDRPSPPRRLSLVISAPERCSAGEGWECRVALADLHRPEVILGVDSFDALALAFVQARTWIAELRGQGRHLTRDREGQTPFEFP